MRIVHCANRSVLWALFLLALGVGVGFSWSPVASKARPLPRAAIESTWLPQIPVAGRAAGEEFAVLIVLHLTAAEMNCPFRIDDGRLKRLLNHHGFTLGDVYALSRSESLSNEFDKIIAKYRADRQAACEVAWKNFGPGAPYEGFLQAR
jgi:hypothetical protein